MYAISDLIKRGDFQRLMFYLNYSTGTGDTRGHIEDYDKAIEESYDIFYKNIEKLYTNVNRDDDSLFDIINDFARTHDDIYFESGLLIGIQLYKEFMETYDKHAKNDISLLLNRLKNNQHSNCAVNEKAPNEHSSD